MTAAIADLLIRCEAIRDLAHDWDCLPHVVRQLRLHDLTPLRGGVLEKAWAEYRDALRVWQALGTGEMHWSSWAPLTCPDRQEAAVEEAGMWAAGALDVLMGGAQ